MRTDKVSADLMVNKPNTANNRESKNAGGGSDFSDILGSVSSESRRQQPGLSGSSAKDASGNSSFKYTESASEKVNVSETPSDSSLQASFIPTEKRFTEEAADAVLNEAAQTVARQVLDSGIPPKSKENAAEMMLGVLKNMKSVSEVKFNGENVKPGEVTADTQAEENINDLLETVIRVMEGITDRAAAEETSEQLPQMPQNPQTQLTTQTPPEQPGMNMNANANMNVQPEDVVPGPGNVRLVNPDQPIRLFVKHDEAAILTGDEADMTPSDEGLFPMPGLPVNDTEAKPSDNTDYRFVRTDSKTVPFVPVSDETEGTPEVRQTFIPQENIEGTPENGNIVPGTYVPDPNGTTAPETNIAADIPTDETTDVNAAFAAEAESVPARPEASGRELRGPKELRRPGTPVQRGGDEPKDIPEDDTLPTGFKMKDIIFAERPDLQAAAFQVSEPFDPVKSGSYSPEIMYDMTIPEDAHIDVPEVITERVSDGMLDEASDNMPDYGETTAFDDIFTAAEKLLVKDDGTMTEGRSAQAVRTTARMLGEIIGEAKRDLGLTEVRVEVISNKVTENDGFIPMMRDDHVKLSRQMFGSDRTGELDHIMGETGETPEKDTPKTQTDDTFNAASQLARNVQQPIMRTETGFEFRDEYQPVRPPEVQLTEQILQRIENMQEDRTEFTMVLNPESLGRITVKLVMAGEKTSVEVTAENPETKAILASRSDSLQTMLRQNGVDLERYQVVTEQEDSQFNQQSYDGSSKNPYYRDDGDDGQNSGDSDEDSESSDSFYGLLNEM